MGNDSDADGDALTITAVNSISGNATVLIGEDGNIIYRSADGFWGEDIFEYTLSDGTETSTARVSIIVENPYEGWRVGTDSGERMNGIWITQNNIYGAGGNDSIYGGWRNDNIAGGQGDDLLSGGWGRDTLRGNSGNDRIYGDAGSDIISGGSGDDQLWGGWGNDQFIFTDGDGRDQIMDFSLGVNYWWYKSRGDSILIDVDGIDSFTDLMDIASQDGRDTRFDFGDGDGDLLILSNIQLTALDQDVFSFV